jgi:hypothetical protein
MFTWRLGRALNLGLTYNNNRYSYLNTLNNTSTTSAVQSGGLSITHRLFQSLTSRFDLNARQSEFDTGKENSYSGAVYFDYLKTLPAQSNLQLSYSESLNVTDRNVTSQTALAIDEPLTAQLTGQNLLFYPNVDTGSIIVRNADPNVRVAPYVTGVDYEAIPNGDFTGFNFAIIGSEILDGTNLLITYTYLANPSIKYQTSSRRVAGSLSLSGRRLKIYGSIDQSNQDLLSGSAEFVQLNKSTTTIAGVGSELNSIFSGIEYTNYDSTLNKYQSYNSFVRLNRYLYGGSFKLQLRHRYANYDVSPSSPTERTENVFEAGGNYSRLLFKRIQGDFDARYTNFMGQSASRSDITLNLRLRWSYGKILLQLEERAAWRFVSGSSFRDDQITFQLTRYF